MYGRPLHPWDMRVHRHKLPADHNEYPREGNLISYFKLTTGNSVYRYAPFEKRTHITLRLLDRRIKIYLQDISTLTMCLLIR